jgi:hypothetical protein
MVGPDDLDDIIKNMNLEPKNIDIENISLTSDLSNGLTMNLT